MFIINREENSITLKPESVEDLWHLEKIIKKGDRVESVTERKREEASGTSREKMKLEIEVEKAKFHKGYGKLKILGTITKGPEEFVSFGSHHSFKIGERDVLTITKEKWSKHEHKRLKEAREEAKQPKITVAIMDERKAGIYAIKAYGLEKKAEVRLPGKGKYAEKSDKGKYYKEIADALERTDTDRYVVAGPGFEADNFLKDLEERSPEIKKNSTRLKTDNTGERGVYELMKKGEIDEILKKSRLKEETKVIDELITEISKEGKATYGKEQVEKAVEYGAVKKLIVIDERLFEDEDEISGLMERAEQKNGEVVVVSSENPESEKLESFGGIAALLRYEIN